MDTSIKKSPRKVPNRDEKYMGIAFIWSAFSKDPNTQIGCQIVSGNNKPLGSGYNGPPSSYDDNEIDWERGPKYLHIVHSEQNAILHSNNNDLYGSTLYVTAAPCPKCMLEIVAANIKRVVYFDLKTDNNSTINQIELEKTKEIARLGKVNLEVFSGDLSWIKNYIGKYKFLSENCEDGV